MENGLSIKVQIRNRDYKRVFMKKGKLPFFKRLRVALFGYPKKKKVTMVKKRAAK